MVSPPEITAPPRSNPLAADSIGETCPLDAWGNCGVAQVCTMDSRASGNDADIWLEMQQWQARSTSSHETRTPGACL
ncbi:MAG: hypothetical protein TH68_06400 [Candidatus Synechococcus spongiarum 142]|uniref:Uncharacterized protein n=1 Tax=Candidatus Synechococcus spongiarum 142 TaxID=1608213 RepID=A0A6N3X4E6_9SYNE|nr:MAG: hypothetical protein TH68_06400 [Candidatus Synechococcus spongiarum 142]